ncbi:hypothetical protein P691DRAFT_481939 [Macrolepiota fuliginosa MF-IS2]|uniref:Uncharacterized protein n=1 Tax=Macrolepiota fuliginosa MF-IS2 TaxID=1400762 RepID=A0A9P5X2H2_9AGAR|nr:hypothetical protein P691DRAFT_481939 [Macrolepiota fuliginosa MF-IS2]
MGSRDIPVRHIQHRFYFCVPYLLARCLRHPNMARMESMSNQLTFLIGFWSERSLTPEYTYITATAIYLEYTGHIPHRSGEPYDRD